MTPTDARRLQFTFPALAAICGLISFVVFAASTTSEAKGTKTGGKAVRTSAFFSPGGGCESRIVELIGEAKKNIRVQMYFFTSKRVGQALAQAAKRGVKVEVILDKSQEKATYGPWRVMRRDGVRVYFDGQHEIANNKILLIDRRTVVTGSYNFTKAAEEKNAENILVVENDEELFNAYVDNFTRHLEHARKASG